MLSVSAVFSAVIFLVIALAVLYCFYLLVNWILGEIGFVGGVAQKIVRVICAVVAFLLVLNFISVFFGGTGLLLIR